MPGDVVYSAGDTLRHLYVLTSGFFKMVNFAADGREQVVSLKFRGDWLGFDGIAAAAIPATRGDGHRRGAGDPLRPMLSAGPSCPALLTVLHEAMSREIGRERDSLMSVCTLPARRASPSSCATGPTRSPRAACAPTRSPCA
jgi:CRP/FNR family transcriptional regulator